MFKTAKPYFIRTISSLHAGSGNDLGIIDLPIQREKHTSFPKIESSSLKGSIRESFENIAEVKKKEIISEKIKSFLGNEDIKLIDIDEGDKEISNYDYAVHLTFGFDDAYVSDDIKSKFKSNEEFSGCLAFSDARLLFFPVKSAKGVYALITCPFVIKRFIEDMRMIGIENNFKVENINEGECIVPENSVMKIRNSVILEEYTFTCKEAKELKNIFWNDFSKDKVVILNDNDFKDFVNLSTEVITRTKIDNETGTVSKGALFNEEYLPPETIMYFITFASKVFHREDMKAFFGSDKKNEEDIVMEFFDKSLPEYLQIGGNATIGKGIVKVLPQNIIKTED